MTRGAPGETLGPLSRFFPMPRPRARLVPLAAALALLGLGRAGLGQVADLPPPPPAPVVPLLPPAPVLPPAHPAPPDGTAQARADRLRAHPEHGRSFFVRRVAGKPDAAKVVVVVPQFHRSATHPIAWTSLGRAIAEVQAHIEVLVTVLAREEGVRCVGTEGSAAAKIPYSYELKRLAWWYQDLLREEEQLKKVLAAEGQEVDDDLETLRVVLEGALKERAALLDGVGAAQARLEDELDLDRFGLEDAALNARAVALVQERDELDRQLARLDTSTVGAVQSALGEMWVAEFPLYEESTLLPLRRSVEHLEERRRTLKRAGADWPSRVVGRYTSLVGRIADDVIKPDDVEATHAYYVEVAAEVADGGAPRPARGPLSAKERREKRALERKRAKVEARYEKVAHDERNAVAARKVLERVNLPEHGACSLVLGQGHTDGIVEELVRQGETTGLGPVGVIVVEPFDLEG